jgi:adenylate kinase
MRRWFFARKPDAGFILADFPATLLQAQVLDEWLEARGEALDGVLAAPGASPAVVTHYRDLGLVPSEISDLRSQMGGTAAP